MCEISSPNLLSSRMRKMAFSGALFLALGMSLSAQTLLVANQGDHSISFVDPSSAKQVAAIEENVPGQWAHELVASPDCRTAYAPIYGNSGVGRPGIDGSKMLVIDVAARKITGALEFGRGVRPHCIVYDQHTGLLYVTTELAESVTIVDPKSLKIVGEISTGQPESHMLAISHDGKRGYTANVGPGTVSVLDLAKRKKIAVVSVAPHVQRISVSNDDKLVFTSDTTKPRLAVIDAGTNKVSSWISLPALGYGTAVTKDGHSVLVALPLINKVAIVDIASLKLSGTIDVCASPQEIEIPTAATAYVSCTKSGQVAQIDLAHRKVSSLIAVGKGADGLAWADSPKEPQR